MKQCFDDLFICILYPLYDSLITILKASEAGLNNHLCKNLQDGNKTISICVIL